jgi:hypothetical protein
MESPSPAGSGRIGSFGAQKRQGSVTELVNVG